MSEKKQVIMSYEEHEKMLADLKQLSSKEYDYEKKFRDMIEYEQKITSRLRGDIECLRNKKEKLFVVVAVHRVFVHIVPWLALLATIYFTLIDHRFSNWFLVLPSLLILARFAFDDDLKCGF
jgi:hypothetical protein